MSTGLPDWYTLSSIELQTARYAWKYGLRTLLSDFEIGIDEHYYIVHNGNFSVKNYLKNEGIVTVMGSLTVFEE